jgi:hypothetical protein
MEGNDIPIGRFNIVLAFSAPAAPKPGLALSEAQELAPLGHKDSSVLERL